MKRRTWKKRQRSVPIAELKTGRNTSPRAKTAEALKKAVSFMFFKYRYSMTTELGVMPWGRRRADVVGCKISGDLVLIEVS